MDYEQIARAILEEAIETDAAETAVHGERRGDELPESVATTHGRQDWLRDARHRLDQQRAERAEPIPRARPQRLREAKRRLEEDLDAEREANANFEVYHRRGVMRDGRRMSARPKPYRPATPPGKINSPTPTRGWCTACAAGCRPTTPKPPATSST